MDTQRMMSAPRSERSLTDSRMPGVGFGSASVLVVDDDPAMVSLIRRLIERMGFRCHTAASGEAAELLLAVERFDLIVTDVNMAGLSGLELLESARRMDPDVAVVMVSGVNDPEIADTALSNGAFGYVVKPFQAKEFQIAISNSLRRRELEIQVREHLHDLEAKVERRTEQLSRATEEIRVRERRFASLAHASPLGILYADHAGEVEYCNANAEIVLGRTFEEMSGRRWMKYLGPSNRAALESTIQKAVSGDDDSVCELEVRRPDGTKVWVRCPVVAVCDEDHRPVGMLVVMEDISERVHMEDKLRYQATHDSLTGLVNRLEFRHRLERRVADLGADDLLGVLLIDLDQFKLINDSYGHETGDELIMTVANRLRESVPDGAIVARLGGDEFIAAVVGSDLDALLDVAENVRATLRAPFSVMGVELTLSASIGLATTTDSTAQPGELLRSADIAMHEAKVRRDSVEVFDSSMSTVVARRVILTNELRRAVGEGLLSAHFQQVIDPLTGELAGFEALARWTHPELGCIAPDEFIPIAEATGLVHSIDRYVLFTAFRQLSAWREAGLISSTVWMSVNLSASQLSNSALPAIVRSALNEFGIEGHAVCLEVTEGTLVADLGRAVPILEGLRSMGVKIAVDDFGTGHSALSYLSGLPLDVLKIDRSFVAALGSDEPGMVDIIIDLAHRFGLSVIAEGVEHAHQLSALAALGCDMVQGYFIAKPGPPDVVATALRASVWSDRASRCIAADEHCSVTPGSRALGSVADLVAEKSPS